MIALLIGIVVAIAYVLVGALIFGLVGRLFDVDFSNNREFIEQTLCMFAGMLWPMTLVAGIFVLTGFALMCVVMLVLEALQITRLMKWLVSLGRGESF